MVTIKEYTVPESLEEAYKILTSKKNNVILGGCGFIKLSNKNIGTAIDLKAINLNYIKEDEKNIFIGADTSLRSLEIDKTIKNYCSGIVSSAVSNIVGVQFRQGARIGASVFSKYGFSDLIPALLVVGAKVRLYKEGLLELNEFLDKKLSRDILVEVILPKRDAIAVFDSIRKCTGDFSVLNSAMLKENNTYKIAIGARPQRAKVALEASTILSETNDIDKASIIASEELTYGSNMRASKDYRIDMASALVKRMYNVIEGGNL
ncbi:FAD-binding protein [Clostridioides difficile]|nr:FAD-binding protein [Clostridioides difficile]